MLVDNMAPSSEDTAFPSNGSQDSNVEASGIRVVIAGAGFAGLTAAIECTRKGHSCVVLDSVKEMKQLGDIISFGSNAGRIFERWPGIKDKLRPICHNTDKFEIRIWTGEHITDQYWGHENQLWGTKYNGHRGEIHKIIYDHAIALGVDIRLGQQVTEYFENNHAAGVIANGRRVVGDVVLGADGVRSKARALVLGCDDKPKPSGYAVYRAWMSSEDIAKNALTQDLVIHGDSHTCWIGPDIHFIAAAVKGGKEFSWVCTHVDTRDVDEGWSEPGDHEDACRILEGWDPITHALVRMTPPEKLVDWKLVYRDPLPTWISPKARIALIGDAAHPFLPTSIQGASQAMEDGVCLAVCLQLSGKQHVTDALRAYEEIRYDRVCKAQKTGESTRDRWHKADFENLKMNPDVVKIVRDPEILGHDAEAHAYKTYPSVVASVQRAKL